MCVMAMATIHELRYELLPLPPYTTDVATSDFHLFPRLKVFLGGWRLSSNEELVAGVGDYYAGLEESKL